MLNNLTTKHPSPRSQRSSELIERGESNNSSDYLNLAEAPAPPKTPDPSGYFPLKKRSSCNYKTALLGDHLKHVNFHTLNQTRGASSKQADQHKRPIVEGVIEEDPLSHVGQIKDDQVGHNRASTERINTPEINADEEENDSVGVWRAEDSKRSLQRRSTFETSAENLERTFNVQYQGSSSQPPSTTEESTPVLPRVQSGSSIPRSYHSNQSPLEKGAFESHEYFPKSFEYADFKRRMSGE